MKQSAMDMLILGSALAIVLGVIVAVGISDGARTGDSGAHGIPGTAFTEGYRGPSHDYTATPDSKSLAYPRPGKESETPGGAIEPESTGGARLTVAAGPAETED